MKQIKLGDSNINVSAIALGIMRMPRLNAKEASNLLETAYEQGVNYIDSADIYGGGKSEQIFGEALKKRV